MKPGLRNPRFAALVAAVFGLAGIGMLGYIGYEAYYGTQSADWPTTKAEIVSSEVKRSSGRRRRRGRRRTRYAHVQYVYAVNGISYEGDRVRYGFRVPGSRPTAREIVDRYPAGAKTRVAYDPADPSRSVLLPGFRWGDSWGAFLAAAFFLAVPALVLFARNRNG